MSAALDLAFPLKVPKERTVKIGGQAYTAEKFVVELQRQSLVDVRRFLQLIARENIVQQSSIGNPPQVVEVDRIGGKPIDQVDRLVRILFGSTLASAAMREVESTLAAAIARSTRAHTGRLGDIGASWGWWMLPAKGGARRVTAGTELGVFGPGDQLVLAPLAVPYATIVNRAVARAGRLNPKARMRKGKLQEPPRSRQNRGFLWVAAEGLRRRPAFRLFHVRVVFTKAHMVPGELMTRTSGTGLIVITPRSTRVSV